MKQLKKFFVILIFAFILPINADALYCDYNELAYYKNIASNINYNLFFREENNFTFDINIVNLFSDIIVKNANTNEIYIYEEGGLLITGVLPGEEYVFDISTDKTDCKNKDLSLIYVKVPYYNPYSKKDVCLGNPEIPICNKWINLNISESEFENRVNTYLKEKEESEKEEDKFNLDFLLKYSPYYYIFLVLFIFFGSYFIYYLSTKDDFDLKTDR